jgi:hypothetical protein
LGKRSNCQIGVSVHTVTDWAAAAVDRRLFLPASWDDRKTADQQDAAETIKKLARCAIPDEVRHRKKVAALQVVRGMALPVARRRNLDGRHSLEHPVRRTGDGSDNLLPTQRPWRYDAGEIGADLSSSVG